MAVRHVHRTAATVVQHPRWTADVHPDPYRRAVGRGARVHGHPPACPGLHPTAVADMTGLYVRTGRPPAVELLAARDAHPDNPLWHEIRRQGITATEAPIIAGLVPGPWASPFSLWWQKRNGW